MNLLFGRESYPGKKGRMLKRRNAGTKICEKIRALGVLGLFLAISFLLFYVISTYLPPEKIDNSAKAPASNTLTDSTRFFIPTNSDPVQKRPLFPLSVIPRGVASARELQTVLAHDPVATAHYAGFSVANSRIVTVERPRAVYVSYRMGSQIFWTKNRMLLRRGETLISDGHNSARTRCGNRISDVAMLPTAAHDPPMKVLEDPAPLPDPQFNENPLDFTPWLFAENSEASPPGSSFIPPPSSGVSVPPHGCCDLIPPPGTVKPPRVITPEPGTWILLTFGIAFLCLIKRIVAY
jgi:hypothetical protein